MAAEEHEDTKTKDDSIPEKSSDSLTENKGKKQRARKKKPRKHDSQYGEESKDANKARENTDTKSVSEEVKVTKRRNKAVCRKGHCLDNNSPCRHVSDSENPDIASQVQQKKSGNRRKKSPRSSGPDTGSAPSRHVNDGKVLAQAGSVENVKRGNKVVGDCSRAESESNHSRRIINSNGTPKLSSTTRRVKDSKTREDVVPSRGGNVRDERPKLSMTVKEADSSTCSLKKGVKDINRLENVVDSRNVGGTGENSGKIKEVKHVKILKRGPPSSPAGNSIGLVLDQNNVRWGHVTPWNRNRPSKVRNRYDSHATDVTQPGVTQGYNATSGVKQMRRSFSNEITKDSTGMERKENASRVKATEKYAKNRCPGDFSVDVSARGWENLTSRSTEIDNKLMKDHRRVNTTPRRRSFDHLFDKDFKGRDNLENQRPCPTDNRSKSDEPKNPEHEEEEEETANSAELSSSGKSNTFASCNVT